MYPRTVTLEDIHILRSECTNEQPYSRRIVGLSYGVQEAIYWEALKYKPVTDEEFLESMELTYYEKDYKNDEEKDILVNNDRPTVSCFMSTEDTGHKVLATVRCDASSAAKVVEAKEPMTFGTVLIAIFLPLFIVLGAMLAALSAVLLLTIWPIVAVAATIMWIIELFKKSDNK